jgi:hypothetical protein
MEETSKQPSKLSYEELNRTAAQLQQRVITAENKLRSIDYASFRLNWLFKVLEYKDSFNSTFTDKCASEIEDILTVDNKETEDSN